MSNLVSFYKCKSIENQLTIVMREILINNLTNVIINIPINQDISYIMNYLKKRKFSFSYETTNSDLPIIRVIDKLEYNNYTNDFYILFEEFDDKNNLINEIKKDDKNRKYFLFNYIEKDIINQIENRGFIIEDYLGKNVILKKEDIDSNQDNKLKQHLVNKEIKNKFIESFYISENEIDIISPWMTNYVVDSDLIDLMESILIRNVKLKIIYGIGLDNDIRNQKSDQVACKLKKRFRKYGDLFKIKKSNTHYKLLLCDDKFAISGSFNFLSFKGEYDKDDNRDEGAEFIIDKENIEEKREFYFKF